MNGTTREGEKRDRNHESLSRGQERGGIAIHLLVTRFRRIHPERGRTHVHQEGTFGEGVANRVQGNEVGLAAFRMTEVAEREVAALTWIKAEVQEGDGL